MPHPRFAELYPLSAKLGLVPVSTGTAEHPGADEETVKMKLGQTRFGLLMKGVTNVFTCGHQHYPAGYTREDIKDDHGKLVDLGGYEAHCIWFDDIEKFLQAGG